MRLLRKDLYGKIPRLGKTWNSTNPLVVACFYDWLSGKRWYVLEFDGKEVFFGFQEGDELGLRYIHLSELTGLPWPHCTRRDRTFRPCPYLELYAS